VSVIRVIEVRVQTPPQRVRESRRAGNSGGGDDDAWGQIVAIVVVGMLVIAGLAYTYLRFRGVLLTISSGLIAVVLGVVLGVIWRRVELGMFAGDWALASICLFILAGAAIGCSFSFLHPLAGPAEYAVLFDAYASEGWSALLPFDSNVTFFAYQTLAAVMLIAASAWLLLIAVACIAKGGIVSGANAPTRARLWRHGLVAL
jgi:hypothetical protein